MKLTSMVWIVVIYFVKSAKSVDDKRCLDVFDISNRTIIKSTDSIANGAKYLGMLERALGRKNCEVECCRISDCNIVVYRIGIDHDCYFFNCGNIEDFRCIFAVHDNYLTMGMMVDRTNLKKTKIHEQAKHEQDLNLLKKKQSYLVRNNGHQIAESTDAQDHQDSHQSRREYSYERNREKSRTKQIMYKNVAKLKSPFNNKRPVETNCNQWQWMCRSNGNCIGKYDICDGIAQCTDKSDEDSDMCDRLRRLGHESISQQRHDPWDIPEVDMAPVPKIISGHHGLGRVTSVTEIPTKIATSVKIRKTIPITKTVKWTAEKELQLNSTPLAVGILIISILLLILLLIYLSCRLQMIRRPIRRSGKPIDSAEGDKLINGMHL